MRTHTRRRKDLDDSHSSDLLFMGERRCGVQQFPTLSLQQFQRGIPLDAASNKTGKTFFSQFQRGIPLDAASNKTGRTSLQQDRSAPTIPMDAGMPERISVVAPTIPMDAGMPARISAVGSNDPDGCVGSLF